MKAEDYQDQRDRRRVTAKVYQRDTDSRDVHVEPCRSIN